MSEMNGTGHTETSGNDFVAKAREHFGKLHQGCQDISDATLTSILNNALRPMVERAESTQDNDEALRVIRAYLETSHTAIVPKLQSKRRTEMGKHWNAITSAMHAYETISAPPMALPERIGSLAYCFHSHAVAVVEQLEAISCELEAISAAFKPDSAKKGPKSVVTSLSHLDHIVTGSMRLLVGEVPEQNDSAGTQPGTVQAASGAGMSAPSPKQGGSS